MRCEWCSKKREADWWAETLHGLHAWVCKTCLPRVGKKDEQGNYIAMPAAEKLAMIHKAGG